jgi:outer membrane immunogenic protein
MRTNNLLTSTALTTSALLASGTAFAQPVTYNWTGWYVGFNLGGASSRIEHGLAVPATVDSPARAFTSSGRETTFTGGFQAGYNWMFVPNWLFGIEADLNHVGASRESNFAFLNDNEEVVGRQKTRLRWLATVRGRLGYTWVNTLVYATGGVAIGGVKSSVDATRIDPNTGPDAQFAGSYSAGRVGWTVGAGIEHALTNRVSIKVEYLHFDLGSFSYNVSLVSGTASTDVPSTWFANGQISGDIVRLGLNYRFGP